MPPTSRIRLSPTTTTPSDEICWPTPDMLDTVRKTGLTRAPTMMSTTRTGNKAASRRRAIAVAPCDPANRPAAPLGAEPPPTGGFVDGPAPSTPAAPDGAVTLPGELTVMTSFSIVRPGRSPPRPYPRSLPVRLRGRMAGSQTR